MRTNITCSNCQHTWEEEVGEILLRVVCPQCGVVLDLTRAVAAKPGLSPQDQALITFAGGIAIGLLLLKVFGSRQGRK